jgi:hypothetical protein
MYRQYQNRAQYGGPQRALPRIMKITLAATRSGRKRLWVGMRAWRIAISRLILCQFARRAGPRVLCLHLQIHEDYMWSAGAKASDFCRNPRSRCNDERRRRPANEELSGSWSVLIESRSAKIASEVC